MLKNGGKTKFRGLGLVVGGARNKYLGWGFGGRAQSAQKRQQQRSTFFFFFFVARFFRAGAPPPLPHRPGTPLLGPLIDRARGTHCIFWRVGSGLVRRKFCAGWPSAWPSPTTIYSGSGCLALLGCPLENTTSRYYSRPRKDGPALAF